jgi:hypothetical protein
MLRKKLQEVLFSTVWTCLYLEKLRVILGKQIAKKRPPKKSVTLTANKRAQVALPEDKSDAFRMEVELPKESKRSTKAMKLDDAKIPIYLWDKCILISMDMEIKPEENVKGVLTTLRQLMQRYGEKKVYTDFFECF